MSRADRLERLLALQEIDREIVGLENRRDEIPVRRAVVAREIDVLDAERVEREGEVARLVLETRQREGGIAALEEKLKRFETQLEDVRTNVAYSALLSEMQGAKREISGLETEVLERMQAREEHEARLAVLATELDERREAAREALEALASEEAEVGRRLEEAHGRRDEAAAHVDKGLERLYDRLRRGRRFPALVPLKGSACGACRSGMPPQVVHEITHTGSLHACEACGVLVYSEAALATGPASGA